MAGRDRRQSMPQMTLVDLTSPQPISAQHSTEAPPARRLSAPAIAPGDAGNDNNGPQESWNSFIAGLSFSEPRAAQPEATRTAARQLPAAEEAAPRAVQAAPGQPRSASPPLRSTQGPAQAQALLLAPSVQDSRGCSSRMSELRFLATDHGLEPGSRAPAVPAKQPLPAQPAPPSSTVLQSVHPSAEKQNLEPRGREMSARLDQATGAVAAAAASRKKHAALERQQADSVPGVITDPAAKRRRVQGGGGNLWNLANSVMVDMAQRLMPAAPSMHSVPPQAPLPAQQQNAQAAAALLQEPATEAMAPEEQRAESSACPTPPAVQTAALRCVVEAAIANPGAVVLPTLVPLRFQKANQKADAAVRAMSARRSIAQQPAPPMHAPHAPEAAKPAGLGQPHRPSRLQPRPTSAAGASVQPSWDDAVQPQTQQPSPGHFADEAMPSVDRSYITDMQCGAVQPPHARSVQQPLTQLPSPGYDDSPVSQRPQQPPPSLQPGRPMPVQDGPRGAHASAYSWEMPAGSAAQQEDFDISGHHLGVRRSREQRQWPGQQEAPQSRPVSGDSWSGLDRGADNAAAAARRGWLPGAQEMPFSAAHVQSMRSVMHPGQPQSWAASAAPRETGHVKQHQQDFSFPRQQAGAAPSQHFGPPHGAAFGNPTHSTSPWRPAQPALRPDFDRQQARSPQPAYAHGYQHSVAPPPHAPYGPVHGHSHPASGVSAGFPGFNTGAGEPDLTYGSSFLAQQQQQLQGPTTGGLGPMGGQNLQQHSAGWDAAYARLPQQQQQQQQQWQWKEYKQPLLPAGYAPEHRILPMQQPGGSLQHVAVAPPQQQGQQYLPVSLSFGGWS